MDVPRNECQSEKGNACGLETTSPDAATRLDRCPASGLSVVCWDWPGADPHTEEESVLFLLSATHRRSNLNAGCRPRSAAAYPQASATSPSLVLVILLDHLLSGVSRIVSTSGIRVKKKVKGEYN